jgi:hypothetical protein
MINNNNNIKINVNINKNIKIINNTNKNNLNNNKTWSQVEGQLIYPRLYYAAVAVPVQMFQHLPGGCIGVQ